MKELTKSQKQAAQQVAQLITDGLEAWFKAGQIVADEVDKDESFIELACDSNAGITPQILWRFYAIGKKQVHPELLISDAPGCRKLMRLPYDLQTRFLQAQIPVLVRNGKGFDVLNVNVRDLTADQAKQVFDTNCIRSEQAQRAYIESQSMKSAAPDFIQESPFKIVGKKIIFRKDATLTAKDLARILAEMES